MTPEMEILDAEVEGFLASSLNPQSENGSNFGGGGIGARQYGGGFEDFDDFEEDEF